MVDLGQRAARRVDAPSVLWESSITSFRPRQRTGPLGTGRSLSPVCLKAHGGGASRAPAVPLPARLAHPPACASAAPVVPQARQLAFGFEAMRMLRTDRISFAVANREYDPWFRWVHMCTIESA